MGKRNILILHLTSFFSALYFYHQIATLYLMEKGLNLFQINSLFGVILIAQVVCEIPTGVVADKYGRKISIIIAIALQLAGEIVFLFAQNYVSIIFSCVLGGIGFSFYSGSYEAMMYDSLKLDNKEKEMQKAAGLNSGLKMLATVFGSLIGGFLAADISIVSFKLVIILTIISVSIALFFSLFFKEPDFKSQTNLQPYFDILKKGISLIKKNRSLKRIILLSVFATPFLNYLLYFYQPYLLHADVPGAWLGISLSIASFLGFLASKYAFKLENIFSVKYGLMISTVLPGIIYILMSFILNKWLSVLLFILAFSSMNLQSPIFADYKNRHIKSDIRATTLSLIAMFTGTYIAVMGLLLGKLADYSLKYAFILMGCIIVVSVSLIQIREKHLVNSEVP